MLMMMRSLKNFLKMQERPSHRMKKKNPIKLLKENQLKKKNKLKLDKKNSWKWLRISRDSSITMTTELQMQAIMVDLTLKILSSQVD